MFRFDGVEFLVRTVGSSTIPFYIANIYRSTSCSNVASAELNNAILDIFDLLPLYVIVGDFNYLYIN